MVVGGGFELVWSLKVIVYSPEVFHLRIQSEGMTEDDGTEWRRESKRRDKGDKNTREDQRRGGTHTVWKLAICFILSS
jgi:hypothetical protein